ncbi:MAG: hypothetical protein B0D91_12210 [Oceanospirillales bacterium LUC14_002_19_P2]|nr:MAG: hypothetical protein B0D91_12210 [Oceanospirillales bacterium LUC14_002_19_P2]
MTHVLAGLSITLLLFLMMQWMVEPDKPANSGYQTVSVSAPKINQALAGTASDNHSAENTVKKTPDSLPRPGFTPSLSTVSSLRSGFSGSLFAPPDAQSLLSSLEAPGLVGKSGNNKPTINPDALPLASLDPDYPHQAVNQDQSGWVKLRFTVTEQGTVDDIRIIEANPKGVFEQAAIKAVREYRFRPRMVNGKEASQRAERTIRFQLQ